MEVTAERAHVTDANGRVYFSGLLADGRRTFFWAPRKTAEIISSELEAEGLLRLDVPERNIVPALPQRSRDRGSSKTEVLAPNPAPTTATLVEPRVSKLCPICAGEVVAGASTCKYCQSPLDEPAVVPVSTSRQLADWGTALLLIPLFATLLVYFSVKQPNLVTSPGSSLALIAVGTFAMTAMLIFLEARRAGAGERDDRAPNGRRRPSPGFWWIAALLVWIIAFPAWTYQRAKYGLRNLLFAGIVVALTFSGSLVVMAAGVGGQLPGIRQSIVELDGQVDELDPDQQLEDGSFVP